MDVLRQDEDGIYKGIGVDTVIEEGDIVEELFWNLARNYDELHDGGELAKELDVLLSIHAPYYMDLLNDEEIGDKSYTHLRWSLIIGKAMEAKRVITHTGFYRGGGKKESLKKAMEVYTRITSQFSTERGGYPYLGVETSGKTEIFGTEQEVISLAKKIPDIEPILNFPHVHSLGNGSLLEVSDFEKVMEEFSRYKKGDLYTEFAGVEYADGNEKKITAIKHGDLKFETLAEAMMNYDDDMTVISFSPLLEHDAQYMNIIFMRSYSRHMQKKSVTKKQVA